MTSKFIRFLFVGILNTIISLVVIYVGLYIFSLSAPVSTFLGYLVGILNGYILNRRLTFNNSEAVTSTIYRYFFIFFVCYLFAYAVAKSISNVLVASFLTPFHWEREFFLLFNVPIFTVTNYLGNNFFVFHNNAISKGE